jgi:hypothetical protein
MRRNGGECGKIVEASGRCFIFQKEKKKKTLACANFPLPA